MSTLQLPKPLSFRRIASAVGTSHGTVFSLSKGLCTNPEIERRVTAFIQSKEVRKLVDLHGKKKRLEAEASATREEIRQIEEIIKSIPCVNGGIIPVRVSG